MRYGAHNFYGEVKRYFRWVGGRRRDRRQRGRATAEPLPQEAGSQSSQLGA